MIMSFQPVTTKCTDNALTATDMSELMNSWCKQLVYKQFVKKFHPDDGRDLLEPPSFIDEHKS